MEQCWFRLTKSGVVGRGFPEPTYIILSKLLHDALLMIPRILQRKAIGTSLVMQDGCRNRPITGHALSSGCYSIISLLGRSSSTVLHG